MFTANSKARGSNSNENAERIAKATTANRFIPEVICYSQVYKRMNKRGMLAIQEITQ